MYIMQLFVIKKAVLLGSLKYVNKKKQSTKKGGTHTTTVYTFVMYSPKYL